METRGPLITKMVEEADKLTFTETESALEALLLESYLIKQHQPEYNTKEKDNKSYNYVVITDEPLPRIFTVRQRSLKILEGKKDQNLLYVFGPFPSMDQLNTALKIIRKIFPFHGKKTTNKHNIEFYKQLGLVPDESKQESQNLYRRNVEYIARFFEGKKRSLIAELKRDMNRYASEMKFERANVIKKQIYALEHIQDIALLKHDFEVSDYLGGIRMEAYDIAHMAGQAMVGVMVVHNGVEIDTHEHRVFNITSVDRSNDTAALAEVMQRRLEHDEWAYPNLIIVDGGIAQKRAVEKVLRERSVAIPVVSVVKDERHKAREILGQKKLAERYHREIVALNAESHRFAIAQHKKRRGKQFLA